MRKLFLAIDFPAAAFRLVSTSVPDAFLLHCGCVPLAFLRHCACVLARSSCISVHPSRAVLLPLGRSCSHCHWHASRPSFDFAFVSIYFLLRFLAASSARTEQFPRVETRFVFLSRRVFLTALWGLKPAIRRLVFGFSGMALS